MQVERPRAEGSDETRCTDDCSGPSTYIPAYWSWLKIPVTCWLAFHVTAVFIYPASILVPPRGLLAGVRDVFFERYMEALYMVQGNRFFAPEPGPGSLVEWKVTHADGTTTEDVFPHRDIKPRLLYHRYFMLSERVQDVGDEDNWFRMYAKHLAEQHDAAEVTLTRVVHLLPNPDEIIAGKKLADPSFYERRVLGTWTRAELDEPYPEPEETIQEWTWEEPAAPGTDETDTQNGSDQQQNELPEQNVLEVQP